MVEFDRKSQIFDKNQRIFDKIVFFRYKFEVRFEFGPRFRIVATISIDFSNKFRSKMLIKTRFEYDLDRVFGRPRSNRIS